MRTTLSAEEAARLPELFADASALPPEEQAAYLVHACAGAEALRAELESLLGFQTKLPEFLAQPAVGQGLELLGLASRGHLPVGTALGEYRVLSLLGVGGMGEVYLAEDTVHGRQVALKLIGQGRAEEVRGRNFRHERKVLAALNHPHIARLYDSGTTPSGQAYLVMEYVEGVRLDHYCLERRLGVGERLALFRKVCAAVSYAHQNLVVHRDLKPANIRVTPEGEPKLLDFGIAKLLDPEGSANADPTVTMQGAMTPEYASPEQIRGEAITTASDVYSLGVVLYELLTGQRPYAHLKGRRPDELARAICEEEPPALKRIKAEGRRQKEEGRAESARHRPPRGITPKADSSAATILLRGDDERGSRTEQATKMDNSRFESSTTSAFCLLPSYFSFGDLDNIVAKALRKEPIRRYPTVAAFSEDIRRHCAGLPVTARKDTLGYRAGKFIRRNKAGVAAAILVLLALIGGLIATAWQAHVAGQERDRTRLALARAETAQQQTQAVNDFLQKLLTSADPTHMGKDVKVVQVLDAAGQHLDNLTATPEVLAQVQGALSAAYGSLNMAPPAELHARAALELLRRIDGPESLPVGRMESRLGSVLTSVYHLPEAESLLRHALAIEQRQAHPDAFELAETLRKLSLCLVQTRPAEATTLLTEALALMRSARGEHSLEYVGVLQALAQAKQSETQIADMHNQPADLNASIAAWRQVAALYDQLSVRSGSSVTARANLGIALAREQHFGEAETELRRAQADCREALGENNTIYHYVVVMLGCLQFHRGDYAPVVSEVRSALDYMVAAMPGADTRVVQARGIYGLALTRTGHAVEGEPILRAAYAEGKETQRWPYKFTFGNVETALGECLLAQKRYTEAEPLLLAGYDILQRDAEASPVPAELSPMITQAADRLRDLYTEWDKPAEAARFAAGPTPIPAAQ